MTSTSLSEWIKILRVEFVLFAKSISTMICMRCDQNFNIKETFREHVREHHAKKHVQNSCLDINTIKLMCKNDEKSTINDSLFAFVSQKSDISIATSKQKFESVMIFETVTSSKNFHFSSSASEIVSESIENTSTQCSFTSSKSSFSQTFDSEHQEISVHELLECFSFFTSFTSESICETSKKSTKIITDIRAICKLCKQTFNFNEKLYEHIRNHEILKLVKDSHFAINTVNLICEIEKKSFITHVSFAFLSRFQKSIFEFAITFESVILLKCSTFQSFALEITSESTKKSTTCRHCKQTFKFKKFLRKHKREQYAKKFVINSSFRFHAFKSICKAKKKSTIENVTILSVSQELQIFAQKFQKIDVQKHSTVNSFFTSFTSKTICEFVEKSVVTCSFFSQKSSISFATSRNLITNTIISLQFVSSNCSNLSIATFKITSKNTKITSDLFAKNAKIIVDIRVQIAHIRVTMKIERTIFQISTLESASKSMKKFSIQQTVCARICKRCKQDFNFNNKFHEHIREHHARKFVRSLNFRVFASEFTYKIIEKFANICSFASFVSQKLSILFATSRSQTFYFATIFRSMSSIRLNFSIALHEISSKRAKIATMLITRNFTSKRVEIVAFNCSFTFSLSFSRIFVQNFHESHFQKSHLIMNDLNRMFDKKTRFFDLQQHYNRRFFSQSFDVRQSRFAFSKKFHLIIENLFEMFDEKFKKTNLFQSRNNVFFQTFSNQIRIIVYFKLTINQKSSINQNSKNSKSKNLNQHMFAKSIRIAFSEILFEKSINLLYKMFDVFCINLKFSIEIFFFIFIFFRFFSIFLFAFAFVSIVSITKMSCINVYEQVVSIIDRVIQ